MPSDRVRRPLARRSMLVVPSSGGPERVNHGPGAKSIAIDLALQSAHFAVEAWAGVASVRADIDGLPTVRVR